MPEAVELRRRNRLFSDLLQYARSRPRPRARVIGLYTAVPTWIITTIVTGTETWRMLENGHLPQAIPLAAASILAAAITRPLIGRARLIDNP